MSSKGGLYDPQLPDPLLLKGIPQFEMCTELVTVAPPKKTASAQLVNARVTLVPDMLWESQST